MAMVLCRSENGFEFIFPKISTYEMTLSEWIRDSCEIAFTITIDETVLKNPKEKIKKKSV